MNGSTIRSTVYLVLFGIVTSILTYVLAVTISNGSVGSTTSYKADFTDATGLLTGDDVRIAGVRVGQVKGIKLVPISGEPQHRMAQVTFGLDKSIPLYSSATVALRYRNLVGQRYVDIEEAPGGTTPLAKNAEIGLHQTKPALDLTVLFDGFQPLFKALDPQDTNRVAYEVVRTLQGEGGTLDTLLGSTASLSTSVANQDAAIGSLIGNLTSVLATVDARDGNLQNLIDQLQQLVTGLAGNREAIANSLGGVNNLALSTTRLLANIRPELPTDLAQLSAVTRTLATTSITVNGKRQNQLDEFLNRLPTKINSIVRTATYGSYFNFYLCDADVALSSSVNVSLHNTNSSVCGTGNS